MAVDRQLSRDFRLSEFPGWQNATEADVQRLSTLVAMVLQPTRQRFGRIMPSSWLRPGDWGSAHASGDAVDLLPLEASHAAVHSWIATYLPGTFGELILEPNNRSVGGGGAHVHVTNWGVGGQGEVLVERELEEGVYDLWTALAGVPASTLLGFLLLLLAAALVFRFAAANR